MWVNVADDNTDPTCSVLILTACEPGDVARQRGLPGCSDARSLEPLAGVHPPVEQEAEPKPLQEKQRTGSVRILPPHQALLLCGNTALHPHLQPGQAGADQETSGQFQVDLLHGCPSWR